MAVLVLGILYGLRKRKKKVIQMTSQQRALQEEMEKRSKRNQSLMITLLIMYFLNQASYALYGGVFMIEDASAITFESDIRDIYFYVEVFRIRKYVQFYNNLLAVASRSLTFYPYMAFNKAFRKDFRAIFVKAGANATSVSGK